MPAQSHPFHGTWVKTDDEDILVVYGTWTPWRQDKMRRQARGMGHGEKIGQVAGKGPPCMVMVKGWRLKKKSYSGCLILKTIGRMKLLWWSQRTILPLCKASALSFLRWVQCAYNLLAGRTLDSNNALQFFMISCFTTSWQAGRWVHRGLQCITSLSWLFNF